MKEGWEIKKFEELIQVNQIGLIKSTKEQGNDKPFRYLKMDSITSDNTLVHDKYVFVDATKDEINKFSLNDGDFLFNTRNSYELVGKTCVFRPIDDEPTLFNNNIMRVVFKKGILSRFINYAFSSEQVKERIQRLKSGTTSVVGIYYNGLRNLEIPLPPLPEQQRIVSILDEAFAAIIKAKANAEQNLKNAKELFESYLQGVFENGSENWKNKTLGELCTFTQGIQRGVKLQSETQANGQVRFLRIVDYTQGNEPPRYIDHPGDKYILNEEDVALVRYGASTGFVCHGMEGALANNLFRVIPKSFEELSNRFLAVYLKSPIFQDVIKSTMNGAAMPAISFGLIKEIPFPLPNLEEQQTIIQKLTAVQAETQKLEAVYQKKMDDLEELKKSILQKAFAGELKEKEVIV